MSLSSEGTPQQVAFEQLVAEYGDRVFGIALRITGSPSDAEDAMQDAFLSAYRAWPQFRAESSPTTWLYRIAVNAALQRARTRDDHLVERDEELAQIVDWTADAESATVRAELHAQIEQAIALLPEVLRVTLVLRDLEGLSTAEAATVLDVSEAAVKSRLHRARAVLRRHLQEFLA